MNQAFQLGWAKCPALFLTISFAENRDPLLWAELGIPSCPASPGHSTVKPALPSAYLLALQVAHYATALLALQVASYLSLRMATSHPVKQPGFAFALRFAHYATALLALQVASYLSLRMATSHPVKQPGFALALRFAQYQPRPWAHRADGREPLTPRPLAMCKQAGF